MLKLLLNPGTMHLPKSMPSESKDDLFDNLIKQKKELDQSIQYASYIQRAILPTEKDLQRVWPQSFVFSLPRDTVSGDFFWIHRQKNKFFLAVGDCTGHGVPGAFLSILGISFLNLVSSKYDPDNPAELLNLMREYIMHALNQQGNADEQKDGIDLSVCMVDFNKQLFLYSGCFNPCYVILGNELIQLQGSKMPVGVNADTEQSFTNQQMPLDQVDFVYLFTDGFPDQFGGEHGKKYKYPAFRNLLLKCKDIPVLQQKEFLGQELQRWQGALPQLDDVTITGFNLK